MLRLEGGRAPMSVAAAGRGQRRAGLGAMGTARRVGLALGAGPLAHLVTNWLPGWAPRMSWGHVAGP